MTIKGSIRALADQPTKPTKLGALPAVGERPSVVAVGRSQEASGGDGIASPLTERASTRVYGAGVFIISSDGIFTVDAQPVTQVTMDDANSAEIVFNYVE